MVICKRPSLVLPVRLEYVLTVVVRENRVCVLDFV